MRVTFLEHIFVFGFNIQKFGADNVVQDRKKRQKNTIDFPGCFIS